MKNKRGSKAARSNLLPTNARYHFYDVLQQKFRQPRQGGFTVSDGTTKIERAWADITTSDLQDGIDEFTAEVLRRALAGEGEAVNTFALKAAGLVNRLEELTSIQRNKVLQVAMLAPHWPVNLTQRDTDFTWAKKYVRDLQVGSKSLLAAKRRSRIPRHNDFARLAEKLYLVLLKNRHELPELLEKIGRTEARKLKTKWISLCLSLPAVKSPQEITPQEAPKWWKLGEALLLEEWKTGRQSAFGAVLHRGPEKRWVRSRGKRKSAGAPGRREVTLTDASMKKRIFKQIESAFRQLLKSGMSPAQ